MSDPERWSFPNELDDETVSSLEDAVDAVQESVAGVDGRHAAEFMRWVGDVVRTPAPVPADLPATISRSAFDRGGYVITIYQSGRLTDENGRWPEYVVARSLANALDDAGFNYEVQYGHDPLDPPTEDPHGEDPSALDWFANEAGRAREGHVDLLLTDARGNGVTGGNHCVSGAQSIVPGSDPVRAGAGPEASNQYAALHEVGHALGVPGDADEDPYEPPTLTLGNSWVENDRWHKTLICSTESGGENACGEPLTPREGREVVYHNRFSECAVREFFAPEEMEDRYGVDP